MKNELKVIDTGLSIIDHGTAIVDRYRTASNVKVERKAADKMRYAFHTYEGARQFVNSSEHLSPRDIERCEELIDEFTLLAKKDIRNTLKGW